MALKSRAQRLLLAYLLYELSKPRIIQQITQPYRGGGPHTHPLGELVFDGDLLPATSETYSIGSNSKAWLRGIWQGRSLGYNNLARVIVGGKTPSDMPLLPPNYPGAFIDLYTENPIGTKLPRYFIVNFDGTFYIYGISADELTLKTLMTFDFTGDTFAVDSHFLPGGGGPWDLGRPVYLWRDIAQLGYFYMGNVGLREESGLLPVAGEEYRGAMIRVEGVEGIADKSYQCMKSAADTYSWVQVASG